MDFSYPSFYHTLSRKEKVALNTVVTSLYQLDDALCLIWGGSTTVRQTKQPWADVDLWIVMKDLSDSLVRSIKDRLCREFKRIDGVAFVYDGGYLPWLGELLSLFFFPNCTFSIDVGIFDPDHLDSANPGPNPFFVWGQPHNIKSKLKIQKYWKIPEQRMTAVLVNFLKIRKNLTRGNLWNAIEYLSRARRELMGLLVKEVESEATYYIRKDRNIEDFIGKDDLMKLADTCPQYSSVSVAECASKIIRDCLTWAEKNQFDWTLAHELIRLDQWMFHFVEGERTR